MAKTDDVAESAIKRKNESEGSTTAATATESAKPPEEEQTRDRQTANQQQPAQPQTQIMIDDSNMTVCYANFYRVSRTPDELILDLGFNQNPYGTKQSVKVPQRTILNYYIAKQLVNTLSQAVQQHEEAFGVLETDVRKRMRGSDS